MVPRPRLERSKTKTKTKTKTPRFKTETKTCKNGSRRLETKTQVSRTPSLLPIVLIELFSLCVMAEALRASTDSKSAISLQRGPVDPKFQVEGVAPPPTILLLKKLG